MTIRADVLVDIHDAAANNTLITTAILANSVVGEDAGFDAVPTPSTSMRIQAHRDNMLVDALIGTAPAALTTCAANRNNRRFDYDNTKPNEYILIWFDTLSSGAHRKVSIGGWFTFGPPNSGGAGMLYDYLVIFDAVGVSATMQLRNGASGSGSGYGLNIETAPGGSTTHSANIDITPGGRYWCSFKANFKTAVAELNVYDTAGALVGAVTATIATSTNDLLNVRIGNNESGNQGGTSSFENLVFDYTNAVFSMGPFGELKKFSPFLR